MTDQTTVNVTISINLRVRAALNHFINQKPNIYLNYNALTTVCFIQTLVMRQLILISKKKYKMHETREYLMLCCAFHCFVFVSKRAKRKSTLTLIFILYDFVRLSFLSYHFFYL